VIFEQRVTTFSSWYLIDYGYAVKTHGHFVNTTVAMETLITCLHGYRSNLETILQFYNCTILAAFMGILSIIIAGP
jgi:hypothetical protein